MNYDQANADRPMTMGKAFGALLLIYALIGGSAVWKIRSICLLDRDECGFDAFLETVLSHRLVLIASVIFLGLLIHITWHIVGRARAGTLGVEEDPPEPKYNVNGLWVSLVVFLSYLGGAALFITSGAIDPSEINTGNAFWFALKTLAPLYGLAFVLFTLLHLNDYFVKPAPVIAIILLFAVTIGVVYSMLKSTISNISMLT